MKLLDRWDELEGRSDIPTEIFNNLYSKYTENHRSYHNLQHLEDCFEEFDLIESMLNKPTDVLRAIWFHDAIYNPENNTNETKSSNLFKQQYQYVLDKTSLNNIEQLIVATKNHVPFDNDSKYFLDIDISILGKSPERFKKYEQEIREEYKQFSDKTYNTKRKEILKQFLDKERIYSTDYFYNKYEKQARTNIKKLIEKL